MRLAYKAILLCDYPSTKIYSIKSSFQDWETLKIRHNII